MRLEQPFKNLIVGADASRLVGARMRLVQLRAQESAQEIVQYETARTLHQINVAQLLS